MTYAATGGTVSTSGLYKAGTTAGTYRVIAVQQGGTKADTSAITVTASATAPAPPPPAPAGACGGPDVVAGGERAGAERGGVYGVERAGVAAGWSYTDPMTGVRVWKVTTASVPQSNVSGGHDYSEGGQEVSLPWGANRDHYTIKVKLEGGGHWLVDFQVGVGLSNWRQPVRGPNTDLCWAFSSNPATPQLAYVVSGGAIYRINTATNTQVDGGGFPHSDTFAGSAWLSGDRNDAWFTWMSSGTASVAWNAQTGARRTTSNSGLNEIRLSPDGDWALLAGEPSYWWRLSDGLVSAAIAPVRPVHIAMLRGAMGLVMKVEDAIPPDVYRLQAGSSPSATDVAGGFAGYNYHGSGTWHQSDAELGSNLLRQWALFRATTWGRARAGTRWTIRSIGCATPWATSGPMGAIPGCWPTPTRSTTGSTGRCRGPSRAPTAGWCSSTPTCRTAAGVTSSSPRSPPDRYCGSQQRAD